MRKITFLLNSIRIKYKGPIFDTSSIQKKYYIIFLQITPRSTLLDLGMDEMHTDIYPFTFIKQKLCLTVILILNVFSQTRSTEKRKHSFYFLQRKRKRVVVDFSSAHSAYANFCFKRLNINGKCKLSIDLGQRFNM